MEFEEEYLKKVEDLRKLNGEWTAIDEEDKIIGEVFVADEEEP